MWAGFQLIHRHVAFVCVFIYFDMTDTGMPASFETSTEPADSCKKVKKIQMSLSFLHAPFVHHAVGVNLLAAPEPDHVADLVNHALVILVFRTHHHTAEDAGQHRHNGQRHIPGSQP